MRIVPAGVLARLALARLVLGLCGLLACARAQEARSAASEAEEGSYGYENPGEATSDTDANPMFVQGIVGGVTSSPRSPASQVAPPPAPPAAPAGAPSSVAPSPAPAEPPPATAAQPGSAVTAQRAPLLIYSATLTLAVFGADAALNAVERLALEKRGYLVKRSDRSITIRVPAESFRETLEGVGKLGDELHRDVNAQDVTDEFADLKIRLRNAEVVRQRLEVLLERASKVEDALAVERELERVTRDIEQIKGRLALLGELLRFSTITVHFEAVRVEAVARDNPLPFDWLQRLGLPHLLRL